MKILLLSAADALPYEFQIRVKKTFKARELVLAPWLTDCPNALTQQAPSQQWKTAAAKVMHPTLHVS